MASTDVVTKKVNGLHMSIKLPSTDPKGVVVITHGFSEHSGRYEEIVSTVVGGGWAAMVHDVRGHGESKGDRGYVEHFEDYIDDLDVVVKEAQKQVPDKPIVLFGHSLGGLITLRYLLHEHSSSKTNIKLAVVSSPFIKSIRTASTFEIFQICVMNSLKPNFRFPLGPNFRDQLTHDPVKLQEHKNDKKCFSHLTVRWFVESRKHQKFVMDNASKLKTPVHMFVAGKDVVADPKASLELAEKLDKVSVTKYDDCYHEIFNETERQQALDELMKILDKVE